MAALHPHTTHVPSTGAPQAEHGRVRTTLVKNDDHELVATWLGAGASTGICELGESEAWIHLMRGEVVLERWIRDDRGGWARSRTVMRPGDSGRVPRGALHRMEAIDESSLVTSYTPPLAGEEHPVDPALADALERIA